MEGKVKFFDHEKRFGFVTGSDGKDYFVHISAVADGMPMNENDPVTFDPVQGDRGLKAGNVKPQGEETPAEAPEGDAEESADETPDEELKEAA